MLNLRQLAVAYCPSARALSGAALAHSFIDATGSGLPLLHFQKPKRRRRPRAGPPHQDLTGQQLKTETYNYHQTNSRES